MTRHADVIVATGRRGGKATAMTLSAVMAGLWTGTEWLIEGRVLFFPPLYLGSSEPTGTS